MLTDKSNRGVSSSIDVFHFESFSEPGNQILYLNFNAVLHQPNALIYLNNTKYSLKY
jgi:hypothetical protein